MSDVQRLSDAQRRERDAARFARTDQERREAIDSEGRIGGDADEETEADARDRKRRVPRIPGVRVSKKGKSLAHHPPRGTPGWSRKGAIHPRRRGAARPGRQVMADPTDVLKSLLGKRRVELLKVGLNRRGNPTTDELEARAYLGVALLELDDTTANRAAAELLLGGFEDDADRKEKLRKIGDVRRRCRRDDPKAYASAVLTRAELDLAARLGQMMARR